MSLGSVTNRLKCSLAFLDLDSLITPLSNLKIITESSDFCPISQNDLHLAFLTLHTSTLPQYIIDWECLRQPTDLIFSALDPREACTDRNSQVRCKALNSGLNMKACLKPILQTFITRSVYNSSPVDRIKLRRDIFDLKFPHML